MLHFSVVKAKVTQIIECKGIAIDS